MTTILESWAEFFAANGITVRIPPVKKGTDTEALHQAVTDLVFLQPAGVFLSDIQAVPGFKDTWAPPPAIDPLRTVCSHQGDDFFEQVANEYSIPIPAHSNAKETVKKYLILCKPEVAERLYLRNKDDFSPVFTNWSDSFLVRSGAGDMLEMIGESVYRLSGVCFWSKNTYDAMDLVNTTTVSRLARFQIFGPRELTSPLFADLRQAYNP